MFNTRAFIVLLRLSFALMCCNYDRLFITVSMNQSKILSGFTSVRFYNIHGKSSEAMRNLPDRCLITLSEYKLPVIIERL